MGAQQHLTHSDFGTITYTKGATTATQMYSTGDTEEATNVLNCPATSMNITAYATVQRIGANADGQQLVLTTGKNAGKYIIDEAKNETIVMPFKNWYTVRIVKLSNRVYSYLTDSANIVPTQWRFIHTDKVENEYVGKVLPNGSLCHMGLYSVSEYSGIKSKISRTHFLDSDNKVEVVCDGYREDYDASGDRIVMSFCFGGTDRYNENPELTTGLDMIYCAPQR